MPLYIQVYIKACLKVLNYNGYNIASIPWNILYRMLFDRYIATSDIFQLLRVISTFESYFFSR